MHIVATLNMQYLKVSWDTKVARGGKSNSKRLAILA
jgi:hypothetical protein